MGWPLPYKIKLISKTFFDNLRGDNGSFFIKVYYILSIIILLSKIFHFIWMIQEAYEKEFIKPTRSSF